MNQEWRDYAFSVISDRGVIPVRDLQPGDRLYSAVDGHLMKVEKVGPTFPGKTYRVMFNDGRISLYHTEHDIVYDFDKNDKQYSISSIEDIVSYMEEGISIDDLFGDVRSQRVEFPEMKLPVYRVPDPYLGGALLVYGDRKDKFINLPVINIDLCKETCEYFMNMHGIESVEISNNKIYFRNFLNQRIQWSDLFWHKPHRNAEVCSYDPADITGHENLVVAYQYLYGTIDSRLNFICGIFDYGYDPKLSDIITIPIPDTKIALAVKAVLASLGIVSTPTYDPAMTAATGMPVQLNVLSNVSPEIFYKRRNIIDIINKRHAEAIPGTVTGGVINPGTAPIADDYQFTVSSICAMPEKYSSYNIILSPEDRYGVFLTGNMLPRPSIDYR